MQSCCLNEGLDLKTDGALHSSVLLLRDIEQTNLDAYNRLAPEYDSPEHSTTRALERLSNRSVTRLIRNSSRVARCDRVLEIGCGTGSSTSLLMKHLGRRSLTAIDCSRPMLDMALNRAIRYHPSATVRFEECSVFSPACLTLRPKNGFDFIFCGLCDPFMVLAALKNIRALCCDGATLVLTLPERTWALSERAHRLNVTEEYTVFRLLSGESVRPFSFTYAPEELAERLVDQGFKPFCSRVEQLTSGSVGDFNPPRLLLSASTAYS
jgi:SAM-dependent methyltransferase